MYLINSFSENFSENEDNVVMKKFRFAFVLLGMVPALCAANDFPTLERVNYVLFCMEDLGGQTYETLNSCSCRIDAIAEKMSFAEYEEATFFERYRRMPGKKGGIIRDSVRSGKLLEKLNQVGKEVAQQCIKAIHVERKRP